MRILIGTRWHDESVVNTISRYFDSYDHDGTISNEDSIKSIVIQQRIGIWEFKLSHFELLLSYVRQQKVSDKRLMINDFFFINVARYTYTACRVIWCIVLRGCDYSLESLPTLFTRYKEFAPQYCLEKGPWSSLVRGRVNGSFVSTWERGTFIFHRHWRG